MPNESFTGQEIRFWISLSWLTYPFLPKKVSYSFTLLLGNGVAYRRQFQFHANHPPQSLNQTKTFKTNLLLPFYMRKWLWPVSKPDCTPRLYVLVDKRPIMTTLTTTRVRKMKWRHDAVTSPCRQPADVGLGWVEEWSSNQRGLTTYNACCMHWIYFSLLTGWCKSVPSPNIGWCVYSLDYVGVKERETLVISHNGA